MKQKIFSLFFALIASVGTMYASNTYVDGIWYDFDSSSKTASVTFQGSSNYSYSNEYTNSVVIPASVTYNSVSYIVTSIGNYAFSGCTGLTSVTIPNSVTSIGIYAFWGCDGLTSVTIPNSVTSIGIYAFWECSSLTSPVYNAHVFAYLPTSYSGAYTIPDGIESIAGSAFSYCSGLTSVTIPNSVTSIGDWAFEYCSGLTKVNITDIAAWCNIAFSGSNISNPLCYAKHLYVDDVEVTNLVIPEGVTNIGMEAFRNCSGLTSVTIPNSVTSIGERAFWACTGLTSVTIGNSVTSIGNQAFQYCSGLTSVTIGNSVTSIGDYAFNYCSGLTSVTIPNSVTSIGEAAFSGCSGLTSVTIGNSVTSIGDYAFSGCSGLTSVTNFANTPQEINSSVFNLVDKSTCVLYVPVGSVSAYKSAKGWKVFTDILPIGAQPADVTTTTVTPSATTADIAWPQVTGAATYTIEIKKNGELICTLTFNAQGQLISIAFNAPSRNNAPQQAQAAGFSFTVTSLDSGTTYSYTMTAKGNNGNVLKTESGAFTTTGDVQSIEDVQGNNVQRTKIVRDGQIYILRGDKTYTLTGQETIMP